MKYTGLSKNGGKASKGVRKSKPSLLSEMKGKRIPKDYPWLLLDALKKDLASFCKTEFIIELESIIRNRDVDRYMEFGKNWSLQSINSSNYTPSESCAHYQLVSLLKKFPFEGNELARKNSAIKKFIIAEIGCNNFNRSGYKLLSGESQADRNILLYAKGWIQKILGFELPEFDMWTLRSRHGPGASTNTVEGRNSSYFKFSEYPYHCTVRARDLAIAIIRSDQRWSNVLSDIYREINNVPWYHNVMHDAFFDFFLKVVRGNKITFVPKDYATHRSIAIEPTMNLYLQLGVDGFIRSRLKRWGIDLNSQEKNRELARLGSLEDGYDSFVTLDLSSASDSVSMRLCMELLPPEWYNLLMDLRSPVGDLEGKEIRYNKISSMGNGYTFALESLIFAAIVYGVAKEAGCESMFKDCSIYGDDIIIPKSLSPMVITVLNRFGFKLNIDKSFLFGRVRESCGADWLKGKPVRPVQIKDFPCTTKDVFKHLNLLERIKALRYDRDSSFVRDLLMTWVPERFKNLRGPCSDEEFDTYIHDPLRGYWKQGVWRFRRLVYRPLTFSDNQTSLGFRKLMHRLPGETGDQMLTIEGSVFDVINPKGYNVSLVNSASINWESEYTDADGRRS